MSAVESRTARSGQGGTVQDVRAPHAAGGERASDLRKMCAGLGKTAGHLATLLLENPGFSESF